MERRPGSGSGAKADGPAHGLHQLTCDTQTESRAFEASRRRAIRLCELFEDVWEKLLGDPDAVVLDFDAYLRVLAARADVDATARR